LKRFENKEQTFYIFVDYEPIEQRRLNQEVIDCALEFSHRENVHLQISKSNLGVEKAVPAAINWIAQTEAEFIVLEDDCQLNLEGLRFLNQYAFLLKEKVSLLCATSPWDFESKADRDIPLSLSSYPLISGWATSATNWKGLSTYIARRPPYGDVFREIAKHPRKAKAISFFLASQVRVYRGRVKAWDCSVALWMLLNSKKSLIPDITMVTNTGRDHVAAHTLPEGDENTIFRQETQGTPSSTLDLSEQMSKGTDRQIEALLYKMKTKHILSAPKALMEGLKQ
jgi:hypothetical protein